MDNSVLLAKFIGPFIVVIGAGLLFNFKLYQRIVDDFLKNAGLIYVSGLITFVAGLAVVLFHNVWSADWRVIITIFGWVTLIKGIWLIVLPGRMFKVAKLFADKAKIVIILWSMMFALGIFLTVKGFF